MKVEPDLTPRHYFGMPGDLFHLIERGSRGGTGFVWVNPYGEVQKRVLLHQTECRFHSLPPRSAAHDQYSFHLPYPGSL
jgi:hypothetical protein